ncbi:MAG: DJ-1/PfpI family protein, partial [Clostridiales bacterium]
MLLPRGFEWLEAAAFIDVFGWNMLLGDKQTMLTLAGSEPIVAASFGGGISPDLLLADIDPNRFCALALPGGFSRHGYFRSAQNPQIHELIRIFARLDKPIAAVCTGALVLARAGILQGKKATTYPIAEGYYQRELEQLGACYLNQPL